MPESLRDLYSTPPDIWSFPIMKSNISTRVSSTSQSSQSRQPHPLFDLSSQQSEQDGLLISVTLKGILASALLQYSTAAVAMPWEVGKLLLQIQYLPRIRHDHNPQSELHQKMESDDHDVDSDSSTDSYFHDPAGHGAHSSTPRRTTSKVSGLTNAEGGPKPRRMPVFRLTGSEECIISTGPSDGVWNMMRRVRRHGGEGWTSLWKGLLTATVTDAISSLIQPLIHNLLFSAFSMSFTTSPLLIPVVSHLFTGILLSPLDLVRTRLIAQSSMKQYRRYRGPVDALSAILRDEGGIAGVYFHPQLLVPAILDNALRPLLTLALPVLFGRLLGVADEMHPVAWSVVEFVAGCSALLVTLPVETLRRRLQIQVRGNAKPLQCCVNTRREPYRGVLGVPWKIISEETSTPVALGIESDLTKEKKDSRGLFTGLSQLYRGFSMGVGAGTIVMILSILGGGRQLDSGWAEL